MKIVINRCFGGFSLSPLALARLAELNGKAAYFFKGLKEEEGPFTAEQIGNDLFFSAYSTPEPLEQPSDWHSLSHEDRRKWNEEYRKVSLDTRPDDRTDPLLIQVVEELGEAASGRCAKLSIIEIPDGIEWEIQEYDGNESVHEVHQSWA